ncbi:hypothetical protein [Gracilibacillus alcaliphilus]|uniref:hypothetical protein n=1 Tax=Gracilibacillus alcaliphilus TaxID=1401441 RepID=UPI0019568ADC|nr:hypothetical protein [Gracilibacillus alcaliphilus]MBM7679806.1 hypothetical protein [Gracilibacillus alcaliphilus]
MTLTDEDVVIISPVRRTLETARIWSENVDCRKIVSPLVSPRMFPIQPEENTLPCDKILDIELIKKEYSTFEMDVNVPINIWSTGINTLPDAHF